MENREILIANTKTQKRSKITTDATTLGELKDALRTEGIDYSGMTFTEGISKTQLINDNTQLPQNVMYKGQPTNNLVILLTNTKKNIASGIDRKEVYHIIQENSLQDAIKTEFGRNYTQISTDDLYDFISNAGHEELTEKDFEDNQEEEEDYTIDYLLNTLSPRTVKESILANIVVLASEGVITKKDIKSLQEDLNEVIEALDNTRASEPVSTADGRINDKDIDNMLDELNM